VPNSKRLFCFKFYRLQQVEVEIYAEDEDIARKKFLERKWTNEPLEVHAEEEEIIDITEVEHWN
jgi:hypothetical protein